MYALIWEYWIIIYESVWACPLAAPATKVATQHGAIGNAGKEVPSMSNQLHDHHLDLRNSFKFQ